MLTRSLTLLSLAVAALSLPSALSPRVRHESRRSLPHDWAPQRRAAPNLILPLRIGLVQSNLDDIESLLLDVSHPESPNYGNHWSAAKVAETFRPSAEAVSTVKLWLVDEGIHPSRIRLSNGGNWIEANVSVSEAENLLQTEYYLYGHEPSGSKHIGCGSAYHVPEHVSKHVDLITPTLHFDTKYNRDGPAKFQKRQQIAKPGTPGFGPVSPKTTGTIKVRPSWIRMVTEI